MGVVDQAVPVLSDQFGDLVTQGPGRRRVCRGAHAGRIDGDDAFPGRCDQKSVVPSLALACLQRLGRPAS